MWEAQHAHPHPRLKRGDMSSCFSAHAADKCSCGWLSSTVFTLLCFSPGTLLFKMVPETSAEGLSSVLKNPGGWCALWGKLCELDELHSGGSYGAVGFEFKVNDSTIYITKGVLKQKNTWTDWWKCDQRLKETEHFISPRSNSSIFANSVLAVTLLACLVSPTDLPAQSCPTRCDPVDCSPGSSVHVILQARILEWLATSSSRGSSWLRNWTCIPCGLLHCRQVLYSLSHQGNPVLNTTSVNNDNRPHGAIKTAVMGREPQRQQTRPISEWHDLHHVDLDLCYGLLYMGYQGGRNDETD